MTRDHLTGGDPEVTSFDQNSPGSGCRRPISEVLCTLELLQGSNIAGGGNHVTENDSRDLTDQKGFGRDVISPEVTWKQL